MEIRTRYTPFGVVLCRLGDFLGVVVLVLLLDSMTATDSLRSRLMRATLDAPPSVRRFLLTVSVLGPAENQTQIKLEILLQVSDAMKTCGKVQLWERRNSVLSFTYFSTLAENQSMSSSVVSQPVAKKPP